MPPSYIILLLLILFSLFNFAVSSRFTNSSTTRNDAGAVMPSVSNCDGTGLLQQTVSDTITDFNGVACTTPTFVHTDVNVFARCYSLTAEGCSAPRIVTNARVGIEFVGNAQELVTVNLYKDPGCLTGTPKTGAEMLIASNTLQLTPAMALTVQNVPLNTNGAVIAVNEAVLIEWVLPPGAPSTGSFPGTNNLMESALGFFLPCGSPTLQTFNSQGFSTVHLVLSLDTILATAAPTSAPTSSPTHAPTSSPTRAPSRAPTRAPTSAPSDPCDQECNGSSNQTPMITTKLDKCVSACVPDGLVNGKKKFGWECGTCPDE
jgi:hypothetical protein